jgi:hypothetical protein
MNPEVAAVWPRAPRPGSGDFAEAARSEQTAFQRGPVAQIAIFQIFPDPAAATACRASGSKLNSG